ncbi:glutamate racemase [Chromatium okenii]|uniref:glutamate racemase n=1 Tax=Chromatium okenii TaxID=61644 RepID=UPI0026F257EC|nr:glutamate racemase [Chromatium okenii]MBV5309394.1 glutamate racemase [Chromatium okenii]
MTSSDTSIHRRFPQQPIGVFDSGVGGLSVLRDIRRELPHEHLLYVADSGHAPYGDKSPAFIAARSIAITEFLLTQGVKAMVIACNTATGAAARLLRQRYAVPIIGLEPAIKPALTCTRSGVVGVMATRQTLASAKFAALLTECAQQPVRIVPQPCPGLVEQIEAGNLNGAVTRSLVAELVAPLLNAGADTLVLGCTHYPHLRPLIAELVGPTVTILDSGAAVARQVRRRLNEAALLAPSSQYGQEWFWTTGELVQTQMLLTQLWNTEAQLLPLTAQG